MGVPAGGGVTEAVRAASLAEQLGEPFPAEDVEWRVGQAGKKGEGVWAKVLAYVTNRAIQERLDAVMGPVNWRNEFREGPGGGVLCGLSVRWAEEWVTKWDGAENTNFESVKGGLSGAMKRAAVQWGIGRYLYNLPEGWANVHGGGRHYQGANKEKGTPAFKWDPPPLPAWALPGGKGRPGTSATPTQLQQITDAAKRAGVTEEALVAKLGRVPSDLTEDQADQLIGKLEKRSGA
jgi:hypothetical protein